MSDTMQPISPEAFARSMGWGVKRVRRLAKQLGACRVLGNRMALMPEDVQTILEATKCPSSCSSEKPSPALSGTIGGRSPRISVATNVSALYLGELAGRLWPDQKQDEDRTGRGWDIQIEGYNR